MKFDFYIDKEWNNMISDLDKLVSVNSVGDESEPGAPFGKGPRRALEVVQNIAQYMGFTSKIMYDRVVIIDLFDSNELPEIGILAHADVVPAGNGWNYEPFKVSIEGENIYGRGVIDNKGPIISALYAMKYIKENLKIETNVRLIIGSDEERGSRDIEYYKKMDRLPNYIFTPDANYPLINIEKGRATGNFIKKINMPGEKKILSAYGGIVINAVPDRAYARLVGYSIEELQNISNMCTKGVKYEFREEDDNAVSLCVYGNGAHASLPETGENAITALCEFLAHICEDFKNINNACPHGDVHGDSLNINVSDELSGKLTFSFDLMKYDHDMFQGSFDIRFPICLSGYELENKLIDGFKSFGLKLTDYESTEPHHTKEDSILVQALLEAYENVSGEKGKALAVGGGTYAHEIEGAVAFGPELAGIDNKIHGANEYITVDHFKLNTKMILEAIITLNKRIKI